MFVEIVYGDDRRHRFLVNPDSQCIHFTAFMKRKLMEVLPDSLQENERLMLVSSNLSKDKQVLSSLVDIGKPLPTANLSTLFQDRDLYLPIIAKMNQLQQLLDYQMLYLEKPAPEGDDYDVYENEMSAMKQRMVECLARMKVETMDAKTTLRKSDSRKGKGAKDRLTSHHSNSQHQSRGNIDGESSPTRGRKPRKKSPKGKRK